MVIIERKLAGLLSYRTVFFPDASALGNVLTSLTPMQLVSFYWTDALLDDPRFLVTYETSTTVCVDLACSLEVLRKDLSQTTRRKLRQAEMLSDRIKIVRNGVQASQDFLSLYNDFARSKTTGVAPINASVLRRYSDNSDIFLVYLDDMPLCGHLNLVDTGARRERLLFSASRRLDDAETARLCGVLNCHLHWHEIGVYRSEGLATYDLGGFSSGRNAGLDRFKSSFGGKLVEERTYLCARSPRLARRLLRLATSLGYLERLKDAAPAPQQSLLATDPGSGRFSQGRGASQP